MKAQQGGDISPGQHHLQSTGFTGLGFPKSPRDQERTLRQERSRGIHPDPVSLWSTDTPTN